MTYVYDIITDENINSPSNEEDVTGCQPSQECAMTCNNCGAEVLGGQGSSNKSDQSEKLALFGEFSKEDCKHHWISAYKCHKCHKYVGLQTMGRWYKLDDLLESADDTKSGLIQVTLYRDRLVLFILSQMTFKNDLEPDEKEEMTFLCPSPSEFAKIMWWKGEAVGFYTVKPKDSPYSGSSCDFYELSVVDLVYVRKQHRRKGFASRIVADVLFDHANQDVGFSEPISPSMLRVLHKYLVENRSWRDHVWEVRWTGAEGFRGNIWYRLKALNRKNTQARSTNTSSASLTTWQHVNSLGAAALKRLGDRHGIDSKLSKLAKVNLVCCALGISTTGRSQTSYFGVPKYVMPLTPYEMQEYQNFTPLYVHRLQGWVTDTDSVPAFDDTVVKQYLLAVDVISAADERRYKLSQPYKHIPNVHSVEFHPLPSSSFCLLRGQCNPSQSTCKDDVKYMHAVLHKTTSQPIGSFCVCVVGHGQACAHVGALLFCVSQTISLGRESLPDSPTCTDGECSWIDPRGSSVQPRLVADISNRKKVNNRSDLLHRPVKPSYDAVLAFRSALLNAGGIPGSAVSILQPSRFRPSGMQVPRSCGQVMQDVMLESDFNCQQEEEIMNEPMTLPMWYAAGQPPFTESMRQQIEVITRGQADNQKWRDHKVGALSGTTFGPVESFMKKQNGSCKTIVNKVLGRTSLTNPTAAMKWGLDKEEEAKKRYVQLASHKHVNLEVITNCGLFVSAEYPQIRVSPDGFVKCACHGCGLLEVKCPHSARDMTIKEAVTKGKLPYIMIKEDSTYQLKPGVRGYYAQVQGGMAVTGKKHCTFVIYTSKDTCTITVPFNKAYWQSLLPSLLGFHDNYILPELLNKPTQHGPLHTTQPTPLQATQPTPLQTTQPTPLQTTQPTQLQTTQQFTDQATSQSRKRKRVGKTRPSKAVIKVEVDEPIYICGKCKGPIAENPKSDHDNSVGCDCKVCGCDEWQHWGCASYTKDDSEENIDWYCPPCWRDCGNVY